VVEKLYLALQCSNQQTVKDLSCFVAVSNILESLGCVLSTNVEQDFFSTSKKKSAFCSILLLNKIMRA
jgi:hypothetical protein